MGKRYKLLLFVAAALCIAVLSIWAIKGEKSEIVQDMEEEIEIEKMPFRSSFTEDSGAIESGSLIGVHIGLGEILGKAALSNGGIPTTLEEHKKRLGLDFYPEEMKKIIDLINMAALKKERNK